MIEIFEIIIWSHVTSHQFLCFPDYVYNPKEARLRKALREQNRETNTRVLQQYSPSSGSDSPRGHHQSPTSSLPGSNSVQQNISPDSMGTTSGNNNNNSSNNNSAGTASWYSGSSNNQIPRPNLVLSPRVKYMTVQSISRTHPLSRRPARQPNREGKRGRDRERKRMSRAT